MGALPPPPFGPAPPEYFRQEEGAGPWWRVVLVLCLLWLAAPAPAAERLGYALAISNDSIGEARDRWQSSSVQFGVLFARRPGDLVEFRFRTDVLTPEQLDVIVPEDRRHAGVLAFGLHRHYAPGAWEARAGADLVVVGPQTGLLDFQKELHKVLGFTVPALDDFQIANAVRLDLSGEIARPVEVAGWTVRPFVEAQAGSEDLIRIGVDFETGLRPGRPAMRTTATGQRIAFLAGEAGWGVNLGADIAWVDDSLYLPADLGYELTDTRRRLRAGLRYSGGRWDAFYGLTWLSEEFEAQRESQFVGTAQLKYRF